jgi:signal transduction histidine kinase
VEGNRIQLQQVLVNLIMNGDEAMRDSDPSERRLHIGTTYDGDDVRAWVDDSGPGIEPYKIGRIFQPLATWRPDGTGMGLAISDAIIQAHGGSMWAENRPEGGARVGFSIPVPKVSAERG